MKLKMDNSLMLDEFFDGTRLIGIVAPVKGYQLCWQINSRMEFDFRMNNELEIQLEKKMRKYYFTVYEYRQPASALFHFLYHNQFDGEFLLPEFKHLDYLWLLKGDSINEGEFNLIQQSLRSLPGIQMVTELSNDKIRNKGHLVF